MAVIRTTAGSESRNLTVTATGVGGSEPEGVARTATLVWNGSTYVPARGATTIPDTASRVYKGPVSPLAIGFPMAHGDEWLQTAS